MAKTAELSKKADNSMLSTEVADDIWDMAGAGTDFNEDELQVPRLKMIQGMSPEKNEVDDLEDGDIFCKLTGERWSGSEGLTVIPCFVRTNYPVFSGEGGFSREMSELDYNQAEKDRDGTTEILRETGEEVIKTDNFACLMSSGEDDWRPVILPIFKASLKTSRQWKSAMNVQRMRHPKTGRVASAPIFWNVWKLGTKQVTKQIKRNNVTYSEWNVQLLERTSADMLLMAKEFHLTCKKGAVDVKSNEVHDNTGQQGSKASRKVEGDEIPF